MDNWKPTAQLESLQIRAELLIKIRKFFFERNVLEVETPLLARTTATDVHIQSLEVLSVDSVLGTKFYLQTSPEFAMKRLLSAGSGAIYQICKAFRQGEVSKIHNPEFTMLEWYQPGYSQSDLINEVESLISAVLPIQAIPKLSYREVFQQQLGFDPHNIPFKKLNSFAAEHIDVGKQQLGQTDLLQLLMDAIIVPHLPENIFVYDFPVNQCALAAIKKDSDGQEVAKRFELFCSGMELANGYYELTDSNEQESRFEVDRNKRRELGLPEYPLDSKLIAALDYGLPNCAGVAIGVDRLCMLAAGYTEISQVISFTTDKT
tara:strand:- start:662 stop:1618 length:957 start_codon:yes stop_codon:yes gene_type:complete